jgi:Mg2+/Co2+ transporter CorB
MVFDAPESEAAVKATTLLFDGVNVGAGVAVVATVVGTAVAVVATGVAAGVGAAVATGVVVVVLCVQPAKSAAIIRSPQTTLMSAR